jgi:DNA helicase-2/ATP-dependent DNA helicase PcrA
VVSTVLPPPKIVPDERQQQAISHVHGPMLVIAGAGTGKTTVLTQRVASLIREGHARPEEILALTYTDNAAAEMLSRVRGELGTEAAAGLQARTFHAWCAGALKRRGADFGVLDDQDLWIFLRRRIRELQLKHFVRAANVGQFIESLLSFMRRCQDELVGPEDYQRYVERLERKEIPLPRVASSKKHSELKDEQILQRCQEISRVFSKVENMLGKNLGTFGHMITRACRFLKEDPKFLEEQRGGTRFILVDEFQDANFAQLELLSLLAGTEANIFAVGDPDQAIYQFRGASSEAFNLFVKKFPDPKIVALEKNRRSLSPILRCAFGIVNDNPPVFTQKSGPISYQRSPLASLRDDNVKQNGQNSLAAAPVEIITWGDKEVEAADLGRRIQKKRKALHCKWSDFAVLYRQHSHRDEIVHEFGERNIPVSIEGLDVLDTPEVRDVVACLTAAVSPNDAAALFRVAALPQFGINGIELRAAMRAVRRQELDLRGVHNKMPAGAALLAKVDDLHVQVEKEGARADNAVKAVIRHFRLPISAPVNAFLKFVETWQTKPVAETGNPGEFLEYLDYFVQARGTVPLPRVEEDAIQLLTAHAAKGLEFPHVAIIRGSSTSFPTPYHEPLIAFPQELRRSGAASVDEKQLHLEEERRLFYVAMTRAKDTLSIYANQGKSKKDPKPTQFLRDFMQQSACKPHWTTCSAAAVQDSLFAEEEHKIALQQSNVAKWLMLPPSSVANRLSASSIAIYEQCPLRFKMETECNLPRDIPAALHYGAAMHRILLTFYDAQRLGREVSEADMLELFRADLAGAGIADRYQYELYLNQGIEQLKQFFAAARSGPAADVLETERRFEMKVGTATVVGRIDRIDRIEANGEAVAIVDYKTGKPLSQEDADDSLQLSLYALAARDALGKRAERLIFHNLENNAAICSTRSDGELAAIKLKIEAVAAAIAQEKFEPRPGFQCHYCPYRNLCPATEKIIPERLAAVQQKKTTSRAN